VSHAQASGISHATAVRVFTKLGFHVAREGKHTVMSNGRVRLIIPRHTAINAFTMVTSPRMPASLPSNSGTHVNPLCQTISHTTFS